MPSAANLNTSKAISPSHLAHIVLRTNKFSQMVPFYKASLGAHAAFETENIAFLTYDEEHHRIAIINMPHLDNSSGDAVGLEHIAFTFETLKYLCAAYKQRKELFGMVRGWCVNHGPTTSMYYRDPDGNQIETQVDNFDDAEEATKWMSSPEFLENSLGADFDAEELCRRVKSGEDEANIKLRPNVGSRGMEDIVNIKMKMEADSKTGS